MKDTAIIKGTAGVVHNLAPCRACHIWHCTVCGCRKGRAS